MPLRLKYYTLHPVSLASRAKAMLYYFARNRIWFMRRWARWYHFLTFMIYTTTVKVPGALIVFGLIRRQPELVRAFFRGYRDGLQDIESRNAQWILSTKISHNKTKENGVTQERSF